MPNYERRACFSLVIMMIPICLCLISVPLTDGRSSPLFDFLCFLSILGIIAGILILVGQDILELLSLVVEDIKDFITSLFGG